jgi:DUF1680 family protein
MCLLWADRLAERLNPRRMNAEQIVGMLRTEHGGIAEILFDIAAFSGRQAHLDAALRFLDRSIVDPLSRGEDQLADVHANTTLPIVQGAARAYELTGEQPYRDAVENFWRFVWTTRTYATGSSSHMEYRRHPNALKATLDASTQKTCVSFNWLGLTDYLQRWTGEAEYGDTLELQLPMRLHTQAINDDSNCVAILYGPHVLAGCVPKATPLELDPENPAARVTADPAGSHDWVYHGAESGPGRDIRFLPISRIIDEEYHVYFETTH